MLTHITLLQVTSTRGVAVSPDEIVVGPGCKPAIFFSCMAVLQPGDEMVIPDPGFPSYTNMARVCGATPIPVRLNADNTSFDFEALAAAMTPRTRVIIVNSPSNPTGGVATADDLDAIAALVAKWPRV